MKHMNSNTVRDCPHTKGRNTNTRAVSGHDSEPEIG